MSGFPSSPQTTTFQKESHHQETHFFARWRICAGPILRGVPFPRFSPRVPARPRNPGSPSRLRTAKIRSGGAHVRSCPATGWPLVHRRSCRKARARPHRTDAPWVKVHFATHALLDSKNPELSGLVLSMIDRKGRPQDGFLRLHEVYNLKLNADLVVLSACRTALGAEVRSVGMIGLTRGFMYAGAPQVLASLWGIRDNATTWFMTRFYEALLEQHQSPLLGRVYDARGALRKVAVSAGAFTQILGGSLLNNWPAGGTPCPALPPTC